MVNLFTKLDVFNFIRYEDMNGDAKCRNRVVWGHSKSSAMSPFDRAHTTSYSTLTDTMCLSCTAYEI